MKSPFKHVRGEYADKDDLALALCKAGGPALEDLNDLPRLGDGYSAQVMRAVWGDDEEDYERAVMYEAEQEQKRRQHVFLSTGLRRGRHRPCGGHRP
ncbi:hypothetical protein AFIC_003099 [[Pseudomonas] carboxydohydrogena]|uniref:Uncharacterized protein n=1 Tax=Afipia carboxydohydrogena TaxID=290 RepID=A0ABY8BNF9_AFICR|nr:hypothetical protein [[Pseudomonas] carboxydohydrogena]WEF51505.1 hypothetical protein AFIC_003099 [[Pseudomonas] carboxydohydrogena]